MPRSLTPVDLEEDRFAVKLLQALRVQWQLRGSAVNAPILQSLWHRWSGRASALFAVGAVLLLGARVLFLPSLVLGDPSIDRTMALSDLLWFVVATAAVCVRLTMVGDDTSVEADMPIRVDQKLSR